MFIFLFQDSCFFLSNRAFLSFRFSAIARANFGLTTFGLLFKCAVNRCPCGHAITARFSGTFKGYRGFLHALGRSFYVNKVSKASLCEIQYVGNHFGFRLVNSILFCAFQEGVFRFNVRYGVLRDSSDRFRQRAFVSASRFYFIGLTFRSRVIRVNCYNGDHAIVGHVARSCQIACFSQCIRGRSISNQAGRYATRKDTIFNSAFFSGLRYVFYDLRFFAYFLCFCFTFFMVFSTSWLIIVGLLSAFVVYFNLHNASLYRACATFN